ncbi:MAG: NAD(P)/FAD-dependent oxidoreductase [Ktedonobacterales bacterium]|nr:NAD(P)/FAD-dependent oxidoreductase [Ktedonobacterales bacterium]
METIILGAGAGGLTLALRLALRGDHVTLVERAAEPGGLAAGFAVGDTTLDKFYHHLFRSDRAIIALLNEIRLGDDLIWGTPDTSVLVGGKTRTLNSVSSVLKFSPISPIARVRMGAVVGVLKLWPHYQSLQDQPAAAWMRRWMGQGAYDKVWGPQLRGKFGDHADEISMAWMWARLHYRTTQLGYLRGGFQRFYDRMAELIGALDGKLHFETTATRIHPLRDKKIRVETTAGDLTGQRVISTLPTRVTMKLLPTLPTFQRRYEWGDAYGAHCLILALDRQLMERVYWLSICDPDYPFLALVEHTNFIPPAEYGGRHLIYLGNYLPMDHPLFRQSKEAVIAAYLPAIKRINPAFSLDWVGESWMFAAPYAQPIVTPEYHRHIPPHDLPIPGVYLANMFQVYPQDRGQNYAVDMANWLAGQLHERDS